MTTATNQSTMHEAEMQAMNRRNAAVEQSRSDAAVRDRPRIKQLLAEYDARIVEHNELGKFIASLRHKLDLAVQEHATATAPLQAGLQSGPDPERRVELRMQVDALNESLDVQVKAINGRLKVAEQEHGDLGMRVSARSSLLDNLVRTASPELLDKMEVEKSTGNWAMKRGDAAEAGAKRARELLAVHRRQKDAIQIASLERSLRRWELEADTAGKAVSDSREAYDRLRQQAIQE